MMSPVGRNPIPSRVAHSTRKAGFVGWRESYEKHLDTEYWLRVRRAVRRRATWRDGMVRCERCGSEEEPFDCHHTTEAYRYLGEELNQDLIKEIRNQNVNLAVADPLGIVQRVADHPDQSAVAVLLTVVGALVDLGQVRPVGQCTDGAQDQALDHARQEFHSGRIQLLPQLVAEKPLVQEEEHLRGQMPEQCGDHRPFTAVDVLENQADFDVGSQFDQTELAHLGKGPIAARPGRRASKGGVIGWRVGNVIDGAVP